MESLKGLFNSMTTYLFGSTDNVNQDTISTSGIHKPYTHFRLDDESSDVITLPDGRKLGFAQYGCLTGKSIFVFHGFPGSRIDGAFFHDAALEVNARIISVDRPGMGWSSPQPDRKLLDHVRDIEHLAEHLDVKEFAVLGISGGGPYALASAFAMSPEKLKCAVLICGLGDPEIGMQGAQWTNRLGFPYGFRIAPRWVGHYYWQMRPEGRLGLSDEERLRQMQEGIAKNRSSIPKKDLPLVEDDGFLKFQIRTVKEAFAQGYDGWMQDGLVLCTPFEFRVEDIRQDLSVHLWYGKQDVNVPANHGIQTAAALGGRAYLRVEDETHGSLEVNYMKEYLTKAVDYISSMAEWDYEQFRV